MEFDQIKAVVQYALVSEDLAPAEQAAVRAAIQSDANKERADFLVEMLNVLPEEVPAIFLPQLSKYVTSEWIKLYFNAEAA